MWKEVKWREGTRHRLGSRFAVLRVRPPHQDYWCSKARPEERLLIELPKQEAEPLKYWFSTLPAQSTLSDLVSLAKHCWIIERGYKELNQKLGLGHYEGRGWRYFDHAALCIAAYGLLVAERSRLPPPLAPVRWNYPPPKCPPIPSLGARPVRLARHNLWPIATPRQIIARAFPTILRLPFLRKSIFIT
jgi:SRSO17 transposase